MARGRVKSRKRRRPISENIGPTIETVRHLSRDVIGWLAERDKIGPDEVRAAIEIRKMAEALGRGLFPAARMESAGRAPGRRLPSDPFSRMIDWELDMWRTRYGPWITEMGKILVGRRKTRASEILWGIIVENHGLTSVDDHYNLRKGTSLGLLRSGLLRYLAISEKGLDRRGVSVAGGVYS